MIAIEGIGYPDHLLYDVENQIWYERLQNGDVRAGFTPYAMSLAGDILSFTPKRVGYDFEKGRSFAVLEGGKWVGTARAAFDGIVIACNEVLNDNPELLNLDAFGKGWMLIVRPAAADWHVALVSGANVAKEFDKWIRSEGYLRRRT